MGVILILAPISVLIGLSGLGAFWWTLRSGQYEDPAGDAARILIEDSDDLIS
ncbi:cbb3-type cytochrome oxidase assembly protein CcoS [Phenylobacterium sp.]|uniref:cbb3-type cytochrome oxidase assembly protein CcoS n=1 Tax=Phenylobacterium sp. TaxID=1871053 RepID=UPI00272FF392|nr:cbb3-type cytochrome oxidase assembly protein CcoS [Phenylobacterium sp.]MDP1619316.1 cbb3-type cytochrome oxidase assembly protein CcoS [Phenylobacterium sp.]MDP1987913.1 cbb3-type cytochrome oxidase assembly protein CcoS [Phenylobacterium sp.]